MRTARAGCLNSGSLSRSEPTVVFWFGTGSRRRRLWTKISTVRAYPGRGLLGYHGPGVRARPSRFLHQPQDASGLDNLIQTHTTPAERGCTLVALAYILDGVHLRPQAPLLEQACTHTRARAHAHAHNTLIYIYIYRLLGVCVKTSTQDLFIEPSLLPQID